MKLNLPTPRFSRSWMVFGVALAIGLLAAWAARSYLSSQMDAIEARGKGAQVELVVAKQTLDRGEALSSQTVAIRSVPADFAHSQALRPEELYRFEGRHLAFPVAAGEMILWSMLEGKKAPTFSARLEPGHRAITVPVDEINSISGLLEPGDLIDLLVTLDHSGKKLTLPLLQVVRVLATGQRSVDEGKNGETRQYSTVTLDVSPEEAQQVIGAREAGRITALLRNPGDKQSLQASRQGLASFLGLGGADFVSPSTGSAQVPVLYGGRGGRLPVEGLNLGQRVRSGTVSLPPVPLAFSGTTEGLATESAPSTPPLTPPSPARNSGVSEPASAHSLPQVPPRASLD